MIGLELEKLVARVEGRWAGSAPSRGRPIAGVSTDTRTIRPGDAFFALEGPRSDGHDFVGEAFLCGAGVCVVASDRASRFEGADVVVVPETLAALEKLAIAQIEALDEIEVVAVTGSVGKTTTKEFLRAILAQRFDVSAAPKSFNNRLGVALTLLGTTKATEKLVVELGTSAAGEIAHLSRVVRPHRALITKVAAAHLEGLGDLDGVSRAKAEIFEGLRPGGVAYLHVDLVSNRSVRDRVPGKLRTFGPGAADFAIEDVRPRARDGAWRPGWSFRIDGEDLAIPMLGRHNIDNAAAAIAIARDIGLRWPEIRAGLEACELPEGRLEVEWTGGFVLVDDSYNANPASMDAALRAIGELPRPTARTIAVLGDMRELGSASRALHEGVGAQLALAGVDVVVTLGDESRHARPMPGDPSSGPIEYVHCADGDTAIALLRDTLMSGDHVLFKGSNASGVRAVARAVREWARAREVKSVDRGAAQQPC